MVFRRTRENFAKQYNKLKHNTTLIERNVRESVHTGLEMIDNLEKDTKEAYNKTSNTLNKNPYYKTVRKFVSRKSNKNFTKKRKFGKKRRGVLVNGRGRDRDPPICHGMMTIIIRHLKKQNQNILLCVMPDLLNLIK